MPDPHLDPRKMLKFLKSLQCLKCSPSIADYTVVTGNQAADMDSCFSAMLTSYFETSLNLSKAVPLIQIPREDLRLRRDIVYVLDALEIDPQWLIFEDDICPSQLKSLFLVDHNAPTIPGEVKAVIDHHELESTTADLNNANPRIIEKSGSCISLIVDYYFEHYRTEMSQLFSDDPTLAPLAISPILQDTKNFTKKVEDSDRRALTLLEPYLKDSVYSPFANFATMKKEKDNVDGFSMLDLLRKDYKQWGEIGISSLPSLLQKLAKKGLQDLPGALQRFRRRENLDIAVALASGNNKRTDAYERQLVYCGPPNFDIAAECPTLDLQLTKEEDGVRFYDQLNTSASRKQVAPALREAYKRFQQQEH